MEQSSFDLFEVGKKLANNDNTDFVFLRKVGFRSTPKGSQVNRKYPSKPDPGGVALID